MKKSLAALGLSLCLTLTGCSSPVFSGNVEKLLRAPRRAGETSDVLNALNSYLGESAQLKYPSVGEFMTPFLFGDWNGDGLQDAAVLYTCSAKGQNVCLAVLEQRNSGWSVTQEVEGLSTEVESVSLARMEESDASQIIVGYGSTQGDRYLAVYAYSGQTLSTVLQQRYSQFLLADITGDRSDDLVVMAMEDENSPVQLALLSNMGGGFQLTQQFAVAPGIYTGCAGLCAGMGTDGTPYLVVDGKVGGYLASTILIYDAPRRQLVEYRPAGVEDFFAATTRYNTALLSRDLDENGSVDIPNEVSAGEIALGLEHRLSYLLWHDFTGGDEGNTCFGVVDEEFGFYFPLPLEWKDKILLDVNLTGDGWVVRESKTQEELLEVRVLPLNSAQIGGYTRVGTIGSQQVRVKMGKIPQSYSVQQVKSGLLIL